MKIFETKEELERTHPFYALGAMTSNADQVVFVRGKAVGVLVERKRSEIMHCLDADEGEG